MFLRVCLVLLLVLGSVSAFAADKPEGPYLFDLMKQPTYRAAWVGMLAGETPPEWVDTFAKTLDGPAIPMIELSVGDASYALGFTCKPNDCAENQLYVLFSGGGAKAWGLLIIGKDIKWLGAPDLAIQEAILGRIE
jgi:hypothetical protein